jgi:hypothetical protein
MRKNCLWRTRVLGVGTAMLMSAVAAQAAMKIASTTVGFPKDDKPVLLAGLEYPGAGWTVAITAVQLQVDPGQSGDSVELVWTLIGSSSRPMVQKVIIELFVLDGAGKKLKSAKKFVVVKSNVDRQECPIKMKVKRGDVERAEKVQIKTTFTVL